MTKAGSAGTPGDRYRVPICLRWQDATDPRHLAFSCECDGEGCPHDPRRRPGYRVDQATNEGDDR